LQLPLPRRSGEITIDGDLSDPGWKSAARIETFYEINVSDSGPPPVKTVAYATYDDRFFYVAFHCADPDPKKIRAPYVDRDNVFSDQDFAGIILDTRDDRRSGWELFVNPRGIHDDGIDNDATGNEDFSPDLFWESAARITSEGWDMEMRIPLSSLRYPKRNPQTWGILFYRNYPRDFRYQMFSSRIPRNSNCLLCHDAELTGIRDLPPGGHLVVAPYVTARETAVPRGDSGSPLVNKPIRGDAGLDVKWTPGPNTAVDATINPDFSQIESDTAQISTNERFALFYPEKRPFFLEGVDLFDTPIQAVYTRTITSPRWGGRVTGKLDSSTYTLLVTQDRGGGSVILPGPQDSSLANQDFSSIAAIGRLRKDFGSSFAGFLLTNRENAGGSHNRVAGPDFQWRPNDVDQVTGQFLYSMTRTPNRPDLASEWDGRSFSTGALFLSWLHSTRSWTWRTTYQDIGDAFRADDGFVPQVGFREGRHFLGYDFWPKGFFLSRISPRVVADIYWDRPGQTLNRRIFPGIQFQGKGNSFGEFDYNFDAVRVGSKLLHRRQLAYDVSLSPSGFFSHVEILGNVGRQIDFDNVREGTGADVQLYATVRAAEHLSFDLVGDRRWLDEDLPDGRSGRLFTAQVERVKAVYTFNEKSFLRLIGQYVETRRDSSLYNDPTVPKRDGSFAGSLLFAYRLNWQSVLFLGYGDNRTLDASGDLLHADRQFFLKVSYAFQR
jgi:Domain of unknown function (DUF5916)